MINRFEPQSERWPRRVYIKNETGQPNQTDIYDADTGKRLEGVIDVHISHEAASIDVTATPHWPITQKDFVVNSDKPVPPDDQRQGMIVEKRRYHVKRMEIESW